MTPLMISAKLLLLSLACLFLLAGVYGYYLSFIRSYKSKPFEQVSQKLFPLFFGTLFFLLSWYCWFQLQASRPVELLYNKELSQETLASSKNIELKIERLNATPLLLQIQPQASNAIKKTPLRYSVHVIDEKGALILKQSREHRVYRVESKPTRLSEEESGHSGTKKESKLLSARSDQGASSVDVNTLSPRNNNDNNNDNNEPNYEQAWLKLPAIHINPKGETFTILLKDISVKQAGLTVSLVSGES